MRKVIFAAAAVIILTLTTLSCNSTTQPTKRNAELVVTYEGKEIKRENPTWFNEPQLREALKRPGKKYLIFGAPWCKSCNFLRTALRQGNLLDDVIFINIDEEYAGHVAQFYGIKSIPTMFALDERSSITTVKVGPNQITMHLLIHVD